MNLKLMRRREPTILSIFDQFDHVCVYKIDQNGRWDKAGYEGSMFLFESSKYPPYGIYILNRSGSRDLVQRLYPEDVLKVSGSILAIKHYQVFSKNRMDSIKTQHGDTDILSPFHPAFTVNDVENLGIDVKGDHEMIGFWKLESGNRTSMIEVIQRLHACIMKNQPYPEAWRYGPDHSPPHHRLQMVPHRSSDAGSASASVSEAESDDAGDPPPPSEVDLLFAKLLPTPVVSHSVAAQPQLHQQQQPTNTPSAVDSLFAKIGNTHSAPKPPQPPSSTGISLLDSIFASAQTPQPLSSAPAPAPTICSPQPSTRGQQQVLNENVISILLGLPPSRTASAAGSTTTSRDGDNESDGPGSSDSSSHDSISQNGSGVGHTQTGMLSIPKSNATTVKGDATPRGFATMSINGHAAAPSILESASSVSTVRGTYSSSPSSSSIPQDQVQPPQKPRANRPLVPFEDESELWPYTPSSTWTKENGANGHHVNGHGHGSDDPDIVELDFADTSLLSDPEGFNHKLRTQGMAMSGSGTLNSQEGEEGAGLRKKRVRTKRVKKNQQHQQTMEEIERGWDMPGQQQPRPVGAGFACAPPPPASPSPPPEVLKKGQDFMKIPEPQQPGFMGLNGSSSGLGQVANANGPHAHAPVVGLGMNGRAVVGGVNNELGVDRDVAAGSIVELMKLRMAGSAAKLVGSREVFLRELLTLIQTDQAFADELYLRYSSNVI